MARIIAGALKGMTLTVPRHIRPTEGQVRHALLNIVQPLIEGARVIDGFAGSGALGLEALSRGAGCVVFLESHPDCVQAIHDNLRRASDRAPLGQGEVCRGDAVRSLRALARRRAPFDLIVFDPPYQSDDGKKALNVVADCAMLSPTGIICLEHARHREAPPAVGPLELMKQHRYGETVLSFYRPTPSREHARGLSRDV